MILILSFSSLLLSVILLQLSSGILGPLDVLSGYEIGFSTTQIGMLGSAHFIGFFAGCWIGPGLVGQIGHSRAFAVFAASGTVGILLHMVIINPYAWCFMRILAGLCVAGCFTVMEGWIQAKTQNQNRGRSLRAYRTADMVGGIAAQSLIALLPHGNYIAYNIIAIICCSSLLPLALTRIPAPKTLPNLKFYPFLAYRTSVMATAGVITAGITSAGFRMAGPIFGAQIELSDLQLGLFLGSFLVGGALAQYPIGWLADKFDRRRLLIVLSFFAIGACVFILTLSNLNATFLMLGTVIFGFFTYPIYSVSAAHANDFIDPDKVVELNASLLFCFGIGAIFSPYFISILIELFGTLSMFAFIALIHFVLVIFGIIREKIGQTPDRKTKYIFTPRTSWKIGGLLRKTRNQDRNNLDANQSHE